MPPVASLLYWLASAAAAHQCLVADLANRPGGEPYGHLYFDQRLTPLSEADVRAVSALHAACPEANHFLENGRGDCLSNDQVRRSLADARRDRMAGALEELAAFQKKYQARRLSRSRPAWTPAEAQAVLRLIRVNQDVLPPDLVARYEAWLTQDGHAISARMAPPQNPFASRLVEDLPSAFGHAGAQFAGSAASPARARELEAVVDNAAYVDPKTKQGVAYPAHVKRLLKLIIRYADPKDAEDAIGVLARHRPPIEEETNRMFPGQYGVMRSDADLKAGTETYFIAYSPGVLEAGGRYFRIGAAQYEKYLGRAPDLSPYRGAGPKRIVRRASHVEEIYDDAVVIKDSEPQQAASLLHELLHIRTRERKGGAVVPIAEEASRQPEMRLFDNYATRTGRTPDTIFSLDRAEDYLFWKYDESGYRSRLKGLLGSQFAYNVQQGEQSPEALEASLQAQLALSGPAFTAAKLRKIDEYVAPQVNRISRELDGLLAIGAITPAEHRKALSKVEAERKDALGREAPSDEDWRRQLTDNLARTRGDRKLGRELDIEDSLWRQRYRFSLPLP